MTCRVTTKHVYDLAWSPDGEFFIAGSTDNTATIWKAASGKLTPEVPMPLVWGVRRSNGTYMAIGECVFALREHSHNVQGVSWDPLNEYIATQSSDR